MGEGVLTEAFCTSFEERVRKRLLERECVALFHKVVSMSPGGQPDGHRDNNELILTQHTREVCCSLLALASLCGSHQLLKLIGGDQIDLLWGDRQSFQHHN